MSCLPHSSCSVSSSGDDDSSSKLPSDFGSDFGSEAVDLITSVAPRPTARMTSEVIMGESGSNPQQMLSDFNFVSPKSGVYRPRPRQKHGCSVM